MRYLHPANLLSENWVANINILVFMDILKEWVNLATAVEIPLDIQCELPQGLAFSSES